MIRSFMITIISFHFNWCRCHGSSGEGVAARPPVHRRRAEGLAAKREMGIEGREGIEGSGGFFLFDSGVSV